MLNPEQNNPKPRQRQTGITPQQISLLRLVSSAVFTLVMAILLWPNLGVFQLKVILFSFMAITATSAISYSLIRSDREALGLSFTIYGLILGLFPISVYIERVGLFIGIFTIFITILAVSAGISRQRAYIGLTTSFIFGIGALLVDLFTRGAAHRLAITDDLESIIGTTSFIILAFIVLILIRQFKHYTLQVKMIAGFLASTLIALVILGYFNNRAMANVMTQEADDSLYNAASLVESNLRQFIDFNLQSVETEANLPVFIDFLSLHRSERPQQTPAVRETLLTLASRDTEYLTSYALLDLDGTTLLDTAESRPTAGETENVAFSEPIAAGKAVMSPILFDPASEEGFIYFSSPVVENGTTILGVLRIRYRVEKLQNLIASNNDRGGSGSFAVLFDENLLHLAHGIAPETFFTTVSPPADFNQQMLSSQGRLPTNFGTDNYLELTDLEQNLSQVTTNTDQPLFFEATDVATGDLTNRVVAFNLGEPSWILTFFQPREIFLAPNQRIQQSTVLLSIVSLATTVILALVLTRILIAPITSLTEKANALADGDLGVQAEIVTDDEIGTLGRSFNSMSSQLRTLIGSLESQVTSRTKQLENRAAMLQAAAEVARDATSEIDLQPMLDRAATLVYDRFGYYHVGVYLISEDRETAILTASTDEPGKKLLEAAHQVEISIDSNLGNACILGEPILASANSSERTLNFHPLLPASQAQLVIPLNVGNRAIGAIDIHSTNPNGFSEGESQIFQTLADQLSVAIQKASIQENVQKNLAELETAYGQFTQQTWQRFIQSRAHYSGYKYDSARKVAQVVKPSEEVIQAWKEGLQVSAHRIAPNTARHQTLLAIPMKVRGTVIGVLNIEYDGESIPSETQNLIEELSERLSLILENARLVETAQRQVEREQLTSHISDQVRQSLDMDTVLRTAVQEIGQQLGLAEVELRLGDTSPKPAKSSNGNAPQISEEA